MELVLVLVFLSSVRCAFSVTFLDQGCQTDCSCMADVSCTTSYYYDPLSLTHRPPYFPPQPDGAMAVEDVGYCLHYKYNAGQSECQPMLTLYWRLPSNKSAVFKGLALSIFNRDAIEPGGTAVYYNISSDYNSTMWFNFSCLQYLSSGRFQFAFASQPPRFDDGHQKDLYTLDMSSFNTYSQSYNNVSMKLECPHFNCCYGNDFEPSVSHETGCLKPSVTSQVPETSQSIMTSIFPGVTQNDGLSHGQLAAVIVVPIVVLLVTIVVISITFYVIYKKRKRKPPVTHSDGSLYEHDFVPPPPMCQDGGKDNKSLALGLTNDQTPNPAHGQTDNVVKRNPNPQAHSSKTDSGFSSGVFESMVTSYEV